LNTGSREVGLINLFHRQMIRQNMVMQLELIVMVQSQVI
jgi:hypothetical protein